MLVLALEQIQFRQLCLALAQRLLLARQRLHRLVGRFVGKAGYMLHGPGTSSHVRTPGVTASTLSSADTAAASVERSSTPCRSAARRVGKGGVSTFRPRWSPGH